MRPQSGQASPRDNVVFEAGLFGGALGIRRTFILHAHGSKLPSDLLGLTSVRYDPATSPAEVRAINQKLRKAIETEGRRGPVEGLWWQLSLTERSEDEPSAVSLLRISRDRDGGLNVNGRAWQEDGTLSARYWSEAAKERRDPAGIFYFWKGERPRHPNAPQLEGTGEIKVETADRATGYWTTRSDRDPGLNARTAGIYLRADPSDLQVLDGGSEEERARAHRAAPPGVEVGRERVLSAERRRVEGSRADDVESAVVPPRRQLGRRERSRRDARVAGRRALSGQRTLLTNFSCPDVSSARGPRAARTDAIAAVGATPASTSVQAAIIPLRPSPPMHVTTTDSPRVSPSRHHATRSTASRSVHVPWSGTGSQR